MPRARGKEQRRVAKSAAIKKAEGGTPIRATFRTSVGSEPAFSTWVGAKAMIVMAEVPGAEPGDLDISVEGNRLILKKNGNDQATSAGTGHHGRRIELEKVLDLPYRVDRNSVEVSFDKGFIHIILKREDEETLRSKTLLETNIINTVSRYFNGNGARTNHVREKEDQFLIRALQRYFRGSAAAPQSSD